MTSNSHRTKPMLHSVPGVFFSDSFVRSIVTAPVIESYERTVPSYKMKIERKQVRVRRYGSEVIHAHMYGLHIIMHVSRYGREEILCTY